MNLIGYHFAGDLGVLETLRIAKTLLAKILKVGFNDPELGAYLLVSSPRLIHELTLMQVIGALV